MVGVGGQQSSMDAALEEWSNRIKVYNLAGTGKLHFKKLVGFVVLFFVVHVVNKNPMSP